MAEEHSAFHSYKREVQGRCAATKDLHRELPRAQRQEERRAAAKILRREQPPGDNRQIRVGAGADRACEKAGNRQEVFGQRRVWLKAYLRGLWWFLRLEGLALQLQIQKDDPSVQQEVRQGQGQVPNPALDGGRSKENVREGLQRNHEGQNEGYTGHRSGHRNAHEHR